jgi:hypothetical protein
MADISALLGVIAYTGSLVLLTEFLQYLFIYRTTRFKTLKTNFEKHAQKLEAAKGTTTSRGVKKREAKLQGWEGEAGKEVGLLQFKTGFFVSKSAYEAVFIPRRGKRTRTSPIEVSISPSLLPSLSSLMSLPFADGSFRDH